MMRKWFAGLMLFLLLAGGTALAEEADNITRDCKFKASASKMKLSYLVDESYKRQWKSAKALDSSLTMTAPAGKTIASLYICYAQVPERWEIQVSDDGKTWTRAAEGDPRFLHAFVALPEPSRYVKLVSCPGEKSALCINEMALFSEGEVPSWVQRWEPTHEKADIMFISTHPDDELIFFGGAIPTYDAEWGYKVVVAYFSHSGLTRSSELLNGLWHMGVRNYPDIGSFPDTKARNLEDAYTRVGGRDTVNEWMVGLYRRYRPEVVVTQDVNGEYGHTQHLIVVASARESIALAADAGSFPEQAANLGVWQVKKLYLHLWPESQICFDWSVPLESMGGKTGQELAKDAFITWHKTQPQGTYRHATTYDNRLFGLEFTAIGPDVEHNDFMENIVLPE